MINKEDVQHLLTTDDEKEHSNSALEWWCIEAFFSSNDNNKKYSFKADFTEWYIKKPKEAGSLFKMTLFDPHTNKTYSQDIRDNFIRLKTSKTSFDIQFQESYMKGSYPDYEMYFIDKKNKVELKIKYIAQSYPHWVAQEVTNGWLPMGLGFYRYGFMPKGKVSGILKINNKEYKIQGQGYFEHVWGEFTYYNIIKNIKGLKKSLAIYAKLIGHQMHSHKIKIPKSLILCTENNPLGYDWIWGLLDNGWTIFYGNIMLWLMEGPIAGSVILSKDGKTYEEFYEAEFKYNEMRHAKNYDFCYPTELEITATKKERKLHIKCKMTTEAREYISRFSKGKYWLGLAICEAPGTIKGYYYDGKEKINLSGICKIEPQRQMSILGHNKLKIDFLLPPNGAGITFDLHSHFLKKKLFIKLQLLPKLRFNFNIKKIKFSQRLCS